MNLLEGVLIAIGLAMDCLAVSISCGLTIKDINRFDALKLGIFFGGFQGMMAFIGWLGGTGFREYIQNIDHWIAFVLLLIIGVKMIMEGLGEEKNEGFLNIRKLRVLLLLSIATSIDALAVGISLAFLSVPILFPVIIIGLMSFVFAFFGTMIGDRVGHVFGGRIEVLGGIILIGIGVKVLVEHLFF